MPEKTLISIKRRRSSDQLTGLVDSSEIKFVQATKYLKRLPAAGFHLSLDVLRYHRYRIRQSGNIQNPIG
jgi:hypothetical protein